MEKIELYSEGFIKLINQDYSKINSINQKYNEINAINQDYSKINSTPIIREDTQAIIKQSFQSGWIISKKALLEEFRLWFCEGYCKFKGQKDYCDNCPIKNEDLWLK